MPFVDAMSEPDKTKKQDQSEALWGTVTTILEEPGVSRPYVDDIIRSMHDILIVVDHNAKIAMVNRAATDLLGYAQDELIGTPFWGILAEDLSGIVNDIMIGNVEKAYLAKDGRKIPVSVSGSVIRDRDGRIQGIVCVAQDVTERKRMEAALERRSEELARSNVELEQFAYVASHDLREPLRMIISFLQLLSRRYSGELGDDADEFITFAVDGATRMEGLIEGLLEYSRVGTQGKAYETVAFEDVFEKALNNLTVALEEAGAEVTHDPLPTLKADDVQLGQLLQNLIGNAVKFRGEDAPRVHVGAEEKDEEWLFSVSDNGIGMDPEGRDRVFEIFQRLVAREDYEGTGIGLSVCKKIVERRGGRIWVDSALGEGSTFYFTVPVEVPEAA